MPAAARYLRVRALVRQSCTAYLEALWVGRNVRDFDLGETSAWLERPLERLLRLSGEDEEQFYLLSEKVSAAGHDLHPDGAETLIRHLPRVTVRPNRVVRTKMIASCTRTSETPDEIELGLENTRPPRIKFVQVIR